MMHACPRSLMFVAVFAAAAPAHSQNRSVSMEIGYQLLTVDQGSRPAGVSADVVADVTRRWAAVGELDWSRRALQEFGFAEQSAVLGMTAGARYRVWDGRRASAFAQVLVGVARDTLEVSQFGRESTSPAMVQAGGGLVLRATRRLDAVAQADWRRIARDENRNAARIVVGVAVRLR